MLGGRETGGPQMTDLSDFNDILAPLEHGHFVHYVTNDLTF